jgi:hypothetical protein
MLLVLFGNDFQYITIVHTTWLCAGDVEIPALGAAGVGAAQVPARVHHSRRVRHQQASGARVGVAPFACVDPHTPRSACPLVAPPCLPMARVTSAPRDARALRLRALRGGFTWLMQLNARAACRSHKPKALAPLEGLRREKGAGHKGRVVGQTRPCAPLGGGSGRGARKAAQPARLRPRAPDTARPCGLAALRPRGRALSNTSMHTPADAHARTHVHTHAHACTRTRARAHTHTHTHTHSTHKHAYTDTQTHTQHAHTQTHTHTHNAHL